MKTLEVTLLLLSCTTVLFGQRDSRIIGLMDKITAAFEADYYISAIEDERPFRANLGVVSRGPRKDLKRPLILESGFFEGLLAQMNNWIRPAQGAEPVVAKLRALYIWEKEWMNTGLGFIHLEMAFAGMKEEGESIVTIEFSGKGQTVSQGHGPRLETAFFLCLQQYAKKRQALEVTERVSRVDERPDNRKAQIMAAENFLQLWEGSLNPATGNLRRKGGPYRYRLKKKKEPAEMPHYALLKEERLFIRAANYPGGGNYYTRVLEQGRYMFMIDDLVIKRGSALSPGLDEISGKAGIIIDMKTGVPHIVNDELMEGLMAPYPDLQEKYLFKDILDFPFQLTRVQYVIAEINRREREQQSQ